MMPKIYLINRKITPEQLDRLKYELSITPLAGVIVADPRDTDLAKEFSERVSTLAHPIVILADFDDPLTVIQDDGSLWPQP